MAIRPLPLIGTLAGVMAVHIASLISEMSQDIGIAIVSDTPIENGVLNKSEQKTLTKE